MKKIVLLMVIGLLSTAAVCMLAPQAGAAPVSNAYTNGLLPDVYKAEQEIAGSGTVSVYRTGSSHYQYDHKYYVKGSSEETAFLNALNAGDQSLMPSNTGTVGQTVNVYVFISGVPSDYTVYSGGPGRTLAESDLFRRSDARFNLYSGQDVKLTLSPVSGSLRLGNGSYYDHYVSQGVNELTIMMGGEYRLYGDSWSGGIVMFATFSIEYNDPPTSVAVYGCLILVVAAVCMGAMVFFSRGQKIK